MTTPALEPSAARARLSLWLEYPTSTAGRASADGGWYYFVSTQDGLPLGYRVPAKGGPVERIDTGGERVAGVEPAPEGTRTVLAVDRGGNEQWQLAAFEPGRGAGSGSVRWLTSNPEVIHRPGAWRDGRQYAFTSNSRDRRFFDVYDLDTQGDLTARPLHVEDVLIDVVAAHDSRVLARRSVTNLDHDLLLLDGSGASLLTPHSGELTILSADLARDGVVAAANPEREFTALVRYGKGSGEILQEFNGDVEHVTVDPPGDRAAVVINERGWSRLYLVDLAASERRELPLSRPSVVTGVDWCPDGRSLLLDASSMDAGTSVLEYQLDSGDVRPIVEIARPLPSATPSPTLREFTATDGLTIPFWDARPSDRPSRGTIVWVHGGPESQYRPGFLPVLSFLVEQGWRLILPNVRGSTGYGRTFVHLDDVRRRMDSVRDLRDLAGFLAAGGEVAAGRLGIAGGSYGGFMVLSALTTYPDLWAAGAEWVGIANFVTFLERTAAWRRGVREAEYGSLDRDRDFLESISPIHHVDRIRAPLFVVHGANDPRVPVHEAEQIVAALKIRHVPVSYLRYDNEGHGLVRRENQADAYAQFADFLVRYLTPDPDAVARGTPRAAPP